MYINKLSKIISFLIIIFIIFNLSSCGPRAIRKKLKRKDTSLARVLVKKEFVIGLEDTFPPFAFRNEKTSELEGYDIDLIKAFCKVLNVKPVFKIIDWGQKDYLLNTNKIDCVASGFSYTPNRAKAFTLSNSYIKTAVILVVMKESKYFTIDDIKQNKIGVQSSSSLSQSIQEANKKYGGFANLDFFSSTDKALIALEKGEIDAVAHDLLVVNDLIKRSNKKYRIIPQPLGADEYVFALKKGDIALKNKIEEALLYLSKGDELEKITKKWFGANISVIGR